MQCNSIRSTFASSHRNGAQANDDDVTEPVAVVRLIIQWVMNFAFILTGKWFEHFRTGAPFVVRLCCMVRRNVTEKKCYGVFCMKRTNGKNAYTIWMWAATWMKIRYSDHMNATKVTSAGMAITRYVYLFNTIIPTKNSHSYSSMYLVFRMSFVLKWNNCQEFALICVEECHRVT